MLASFSADEMGGKRGGKHIELLHFFLLGSHLICLLCDWPRGHKNGIISWRSYPVNAFLPLNQLSKVSVRRDAACFCWCILMRSKVMSSSLTIRCL